MFIYKSLKTRVIDLEKLVSGNPHSYDEYKNPLRQRAVTDAKRLIHEATIVHDEYKNTTLTVVEAINLILEKLDLKIEFHPGSPAKYSIENKQEKKKSKSK